MHYNCPIDIKSTMLKKKLLSLPLLLFCLFNVDAQEQSNIKLRIEPGALLDSDSENLGLFLNMEPKIKISEHTVIGLRFGVVLNPQKFDDHNNSQFLVNEENDNAVISFIPTFDYYLNDKNTRPYLGFGIGYFIFSSVDIANPTENVSEGNVNNQIGLLLRGGIDLGNKLRFGLEYNFVPKADIEIPNDQIIGTVDNSYLGLSIGFTIGGRRLIE